MLNHNNEIATVTENGKEHNTNNTKFDRFLLNSEVLFEVSGNTKMAMLSS